MELTAALELPPITPAFVQGTGRPETAAARAGDERLVNTSRYSDAVTAIADVQVPSSSASDPALRALHCETWARLYLGDLELASALGERACSLAEGVAFTDLERAESLFRLGAVRG